MFKSLKDVFSLIDWSKMSCDNSAPWLLFFFVFQEMQKMFNSYKCLMISVNLTSRHFLCGGNSSCEKLQQIQEALSSANISWTQACSGLGQWEQKLRSALIQCQVSLEEAKVGLKRICFQLTISCLWASILATILSVISSWMLFLVFLNKLSVSTLRCFG